MLLVRKRTSVLHHTPKRNINSTNKKSGRKYGQKRKLEKQTDENDFLGMKRFNDKSYSPLLKFLWFLLIFSCIAGSVIQIYLRCETYFEDPVVIEIKLTDRISVTFPSITICNLHLYNLLTSPYNITNNINFTDTYNLWYSLGMNPTNISVLTDCEEAKRDFGDCLKPVTESMTVELMNSLLGTCIMLAMKTKMAFVGPDTEAKFALGPTPLNLPDNYKLFIIVIHGDKFHHVYDYTVFLEYVKYGYLTDFRMYSKEYRNLNGRKNPCMFDEIAHMCINNCIDRKMLNVINCGLPFIFNKSLPQCSSLEDTRKNYQLTFPIWFNLIRHVNKCPCHRKCNQVRYIFSKNYLPIQPKNKTKLYLQYAGDKDEIITEKRMMTIEGLFSDIGGTMGLYLGLSIFTIVDFLEKLIRRALKSKYAR